MSVGNNLCPQCSFHTDMPLLHLINANIVQEEVPDVFRAVFPSMEKATRGSLAGNWKTPSLITLYSLQSCAKSAVYEYPHQIHSTFPWGTVKYLTSQMLYHPHCASKASEAQRQPHDPPQISDLALLTRRWHCQPLTQTLCHDIPLRLQPWFSPQIMLLQIKFYLQLDFPINNHVTYKKDN